MNVPDLSDVPTETLLREQHEAALELDRIAVRMADLSKRAASLARTQLVGIQALRARGVAERDLRHLDPEPAP